jgi:hypothetical protein
MERGARMRRWPFMETVLAFFGGVSGAVVGGVVLIVLIGVLLLMRSSRKLGETT